MTTRRTWLSLLILVALAHVPAVAHGQETGAGVGQLLRDRGASDDFIASVEGIIRSIDEIGVPTNALAQKALEGWAKRRRVGLDRVLTALDQLGERLVEANDLAGDVGGTTQSRGEVVAAAADALGQGMSREQVQEVITAAPTPEAAATGLTVASSMVAQGLETAASVRAVRTAFEEGRRPEDMLEFPSVIAGLTGAGTPLADIARQILQGGGLPTAGQAGSASRPQAVPPTRGPVPGQRPDTPNPPGPTRP